MTTHTELDSKLDALIPEWAALLRELIPEIADEYRATDDPEDSEPGMCVTIGTNDELDSWGYQTGDNSYSGGACGFETVRRLCEKIGLDVRLIDASKRIDVILVADKRAEVAA